MAPVKEYINLLPREEKALAQTVNVWSTAVIFLVLVWLVLFGLEFRQRWDLQGKLDSLTVKKKTVEEQVAALRADLGLTAAPGTDPEKTALIQSLLKERVRWSEVFKQFSRIIPRGVWFDSLEGSSAGKAEIKIRGGAFNYLSIADFMLSLEQSAYFEKPQLLYAQKAVAKGHEVIGFEIICGIKKARGGP